jgi:hypothetical protein
LLGRLAKTRGVLLRLVQGLQGGFPPSLEFRGNPPVGGIDLLVAMTRPLRLVLQPLQGVALRPIEFRLLLLALCEGLRIQVEFRWG